MARIRARARAVDMLGRQQIAGIPNAISELFKNAHDAYATRVEADFYRPEQLLVLRDDGLGMTLRDVEDRWLVLGTESKMTGDRELDTVASTLQMQTRIPTGEKGIGRLAIAAIGPQVLLLTRARRADGMHNAVAAFVNWTLFTLPGVSLDEIEIPVREFHEGRLPEETDIQCMVDVVRNNLDQLRDRIDHRSAEQIDQELDRFNLDASVLQTRFQSSSLTEMRSGTQFYIQPTDQMLEIALQEGQGRRKVADLRRMLIGFTNTMMPNSVQAPIVTGFRDHHSADFSESIIGAEAFFTPDEFASADHHIRGQFDEFGQFVGTVSIYGGEPESHSIAWPEARGRRTDCGPFSIEFAYVQGAQRESRLEPEQWNALVSKLDVLGGLYIYRNGIRILPYGNTENDFLRIEERRGQGASYYFFTYRRMVGTIELPPGSADKLVEKAGREGFRENRAYRHFRAILEKFFVQLAADYFREESIRSNQYVERRAELNRQARAQDLQSRHPVALVARDCRSRARRTRQSRFLHLLFAGFVQAHQDFIVFIGTVIDLQHVFHGTHKVRTAFRRDAPTLFQPRLEFVFFSVLRTVSGWMLSTISHSTSRSANNLSVQRARPSGASPQASAIKWASAAPSSFFGRRRCCSLRPKAASIPSSTQRRRIRSTVLAEINWLQHSMTVATGFRTDRSQPKQMTS